MSARHSRPFPAGLPTRSLAYSPPLTPLLPTGSFSVKSNLLSHLHASSELCAYNTHHTLHSLLPHTPRFPPSCELSSAVTFCRSSFPVCSFHPDAGLGSLPSVPTAQSSVLAPVRLSDNDLLHQTEQSYLRMRTGFQSPPCLQGLAQCPAYSEYLLTVC